MGSLAIFTCLVLSSLSNIMWIDVVLVDTSDLSNHSRLYDNIPGEITPSWLKAMFFPTQAEC